MKTIPTLASILVLALATTSLALAQDEAKPAEPAANPRVLLETSMGSITLELYPDKAPKSVENFLAYVEAGFYKGTIFHRVIPNFMVQGGGFDSDLNKKPTRSPIDNEADNGLINERGTVALARTSDPNSATSQFFFNTVDNKFLNHTAKNARGWGYAVFGRVVDGMSVVDAIAGVETGVKGRMRDVPTDNVTLLEAKVLQ